MPFASKSPHSLLLDGQEAYVLCPDFVVWDQITVELKAVLRNLGQPEFVQLFDYLKRRQDRLGLLVNFGLDRVQVERMAYDPQAANLVEDWQYWTGSIQDDDRAVGLAVRDALHAIFKAHGTGYGDEVLTRLMLCALRNARLGLSVSPTSKAHYRGVEVDESALDCIVVEGRILLSTTALFDTNQFSVSRGLSYMKTLACNGALPWILASATCISPDCAGQRSDPTDGTAIPRMNAGQNTMDECWAVRRCANLDR